MEIKTNGNLWWCPKCDNRQRARYGEGIKNCNGCGFKVKARVIYVSHSIWIPEISSIEEA